MQIKDLIDLYMKLSERLAFFWNFYIVSTIALLTFFFSQIRQVTTPLKIALILAYLVVAAMNVNGLFEINKLQLATTTELKRQANLNPEASIFIRDFCFRDLAQERRLALIIHGISGLIVIAIILLAS